MYHGELERHKQKMADGERNMDEWNKSKSRIHNCSIQRLDLVNPVQKPSPHVQVYQRPVSANQNLRPTPGYVSIRSSERETFFCIHRLVVQTLADLGGWEMTFKTINLVHKGS